MISFMRIDDRIIHGQVVTRWAMELPCDGIIVVNDAAATSEILNTALKSASPKKTLIYTLEQFKEKMTQAVGSQKRYFLITKDPMTMCSLLVDYNMQTGLKAVNVGPQSARQNTIHINKNAEITKEEIESYKKIHSKGYEIDFRIVPDETQVLWSSHKR